MPAELSHRVRLRDGNEMPRLGLGVWRAAPGDETLRAVATALDAGYRLIDTAKLYGNESEVGAAIRASPVPREEIFVTTKVWNDDHGPRRARAAFAASLQRLGLDYIDLYLIHWPGTDEGRDTWPTLVELTDGGRCRSVGVSNFSVEQLEALAAVSPVVPAVNQVPLHPRGFDRGLVDYCRRQRIQVEAYSPLARGAALTDPTVLAIARAHQRSAAQVVLRWELQHDLVVIPKSVHADRIRENAAVFDFVLSASEMATLDARAGDAAPRQG